MKARLVKAGLPGFKGFASLYHVEPGGPLPEYVVVSTINDFFANETYVFESDKDGNILNWSELDGSQLGECLHEEALNNAGYEVEP